MLPLDNTVLILVDYQEKLANVMHHREELHTNMIRLVKGIQLLDIPIVWLEQYPQGLGPTAAEIRSILGEDGQEALAKVDFSACQDTNVQATLDTLGKDHYLVAGIEAHICVYQTVSELINAGKHVEYVQDAISSRTSENKQIAINKMNRIGAFPTSVEMALFELMGTAKHPLFKEISQLIK